MKKLTALVLSLVLLLGLMAGCQEPAEAPETTAAPVETVPADTAPVDTEPPEGLFGGEFEMNLNDVTVKVTIPGDFIGGNVDEACVGAYTDDYLSFLTYSLVADGNVEDLRLEIENEAFYANSEGYYKTHGMGEEIEGFTTMYLVCEDTVYSWYAWKDIDGVILFASAQVEDRDMTLEELIATMEIIIE